MIGRTAGARRGLRWGIVALATVVTLVAIASDPAEARSRRKRGGGGGYHPPYAAIVVDVNAGQVLHAANADSTRHPASLTKIMTLYLLFEQIEAGKLSMDSRLPVSEHASRQAPSKLGLRPGQSIEVEGAIKALVTKSANDVAVVVGEAIAGDEDEFAKLMTRKARAIGMSRTVYANASGLPDPDQITTARDQATLGRAIQDRFPRMYRYFSTHTFYYRGRGMRNHNRLLGRVQGVDGIKTGYIRASGFNLVASMRRGGRHVVAVVMGGPSGGVRDARMRQLLEGYVVEASVRRTTTKIAEAPDTAEPPAKRASQPADPRLPIVIAAVDQAPKSQVLATPAKTEAPPLPMGSAAIGSAEPIKPTLVKTVTVKRAAASAASTLPAPEARSPAVAEPIAARGVALPKQVAAAGEAAASAAFAGESRAPARTHTARGEWMIQVGAFPAETQAKDRLKAAQSVARIMLSDAEPFTERVTKRDATLYRARFAGFDKDQADAACKHLKRNEIACLALKN